MHGLSGALDHKNSLSVIQLRQLLIDIKEHAPNVCVRFRLIGEMWQEQMMRVIVVTEERVLVHNEVSNKLISTPLQHIVQFEVDNKFKTLQPYNHYDIVIENAVFV